MYALVRNAALRIMKAPTGPPDPPAGSHDHMRIYRASPRWLTYRLLVFWIVFFASWLIPWVVVLLGFARGRPPLVLLGFLLIPVLVVMHFCAYFAVRIDYDLRYYIVTDRSLRVREGAFVVKEKTISYANVQNLRVVQGPLLRLLGIWHLQVDTAGGGASEEKRPGTNIHRVRMAGVEIAHEVRDRILAQLRKRGMGAGLGDLDDEDEVAARALSGELLDSLREVKQATAALRAAAESRA